MQHFTWNVFAQTGDIEAYLLYKEMAAYGVPNAEMAQIADGEESQSGDEE